MNDVYYTKICDKCLLADREQRILKSINLSLKHFGRLAQDTLNRTTAKIKCDSQLQLCRLRKNLLRTLLTARITYNKSTGLDFWLSEAAKYPLLAPLAQDLLSAPASQAYEERAFSVCGDLTTGKRNHLKREGGEPAHRACLK